MAERNALTEEQWLTSADPDVLFFALARTRSHARFCDQLRANVGERKLRLFAAACCRTIWDLMDDAEGLLRLCVEICEMEADQQVNRLQLKLAEEPLEVLSEQWRQARDEDDPHLEAVAAVLSAVDPDAAMAVFAYEHTTAARLKANRLVAPTSSRAAMVAHGAYGLELEILRDIFNPFGGPPFGGSSTASGPAAVRQLARTIYAERTFADMPVLADALAEAGCTDPKLVQHCREGGTHVRGCWAIDNILDWK